MHSEPILAKVMDLLVDTVCVVNPEGTFVFVSAACESMFGYTQEEMVGRNMVDLLHPQDRERTLRHVTDIMAGYPAKHIENRYIRKDGSHVHIMWTARWSESEQLRVAVARDVTELRRAERMQSAVFRISEAAEQAEGLSELYRHIHQIIAELLPAENFRVVLYDRTSNTLSFPYFVDEQVTRADAQPLLPGSPLARVIMEGQPLLVRSDQSSATRSAPAVDDGYLDWLAVPLVSHTGTVGAIVLQSYGSHLRYSDEDRDLLRFVSSQITTAIERKQAETRLRHLAGHDPLTDLPNRMLLQDRFETALSQARRNQEHLALLYLDLDGFKEVNDTHGHGIGDQVLCEVARRLSGCMRGSDTVGRLGGDEFVVLLNGIGTQMSLDAVAGKVRDLISAPCYLDGQELFLSASIGTALYPDHGTTWETLARHADGNMYAAKRGGVLTTSD